MSGIPLLARMVSGGTVGFFLAALLVKTPEHPAAAAFFFAVLVGGTIGIWHLKDQ